MDKQCLAILGLRSGWVVKVLFLIGFYNLQTVILVLLAMVRVS